MRNAISVAGIIDHTRIGRLQWAAISLCGLVALLDGFDNQAIAFVAPLVAADLHLAMSEFGPIFGSGLFGLMVGTLTFGPVADRVGRKPVIVLSVATFGVLTLLTPMAHTVGSLATLRFLAGVGLGGALPNVIALTSEYAPQAKRATMVSLMFCGIPLGAVLGGLLSTYLMVRYGWRSVFYVGGTLPLLLLPFLLVLLPESLAFLVARNASNGRILPLLRRLNPDANYPHDTVCVVPERPAQGSPVSQLFREGRAPVTLLLWLTFFCNLLVMFFLISWLPTVMRQTYAAVEQAALATVVLNAGGVTGGLVLGRLIDKRVPFTFVSVAYAAGAVMTGVLGFTAHTNIVTFMVSIYAAGILMLGLQFCMNAIAASYYPTHLRSTGVGWALGVGRTGSVVGPIIGGVLIGLGWSTERLFVAAAIPALLASLSVFLVGVQTRRARQRVAATIPAPSGAFEGAVAAMGPATVDAAE